MVLRFIFCVRTSTRLKCTYLQRKQICSVSDMTWSAEKASRAIAHPLWPSELSREDQPRSVHVVLGGRSYNLLMFSANIVKNGGWRHQRFWHPHTYCYSFFHFVCKNLAPSYQMLEHQVNFGLLFFGFGSHFYLWRSGQFRAFLFCTKTIINGENI